MFQHQNPHPKFFKILKSRSTQNERGFAIPVELGTSHFCFGIWRAVENSKCAEVKHTKNGTTASRLRDQVGSRVNPYSYSTLT